MEDEYDMEVEIERQLAQEEEDMAEMQENLSNLKLAQEKLKAASNNNAPEETPKNQKPSPRISDQLAKIPFLPEALVLRGHRGSDPGCISYYRGSSIGSDIYQRKDDVSLVVPSINLNDRKPYRRDSVQIAIIPRERERRIPSIQRAQSMCKDDRFPSYPRYRVEIRTKQSVTGEKKSASPLSVNKNLTTELTRKDSSTSRGLCRDGSAKRVTIDAAAKKDEEDAPSAGVSPREQKQRQINWHRRRKSSGSSCRVSIDDSISQSLMASFDIAGRVDVDSTSCSVCSSEDVSNLTSSLANSPRNYHCSSPRSAVRHNASEASLSDSLPHCPEVPLDEEEATLASSNDSFATDTVPPELSGDSSSLSEIAASLPVPPSPRLPRRHDRQVRSLHGLRPRPRPVVPKSPLSSSLNELPQCQKRLSPLLHHNVSATTVGSAPQTPNLIRKEVNRRTNSDCVVKYSSDVPSESHEHDFRSLQSS